MTGPVDLPHDLGIGVRWGGHELPPQAGFAVYERGTGGLLAAARVYDDVDAPLPDS
jgi:hypothetical protein